MPTGGAEIHKVILKVDEEHFIVFVDSEDDLKKWKKEPDSTPLAQVVSNFHVHTGQGAQGKLDKASKATLENAFGNVDEEEIIKRILKEGQYQLANVRTRDSSTNDSKGSRSIQS